MQLHILSNISNFSFCGPQAHGASIHVNYFCFEREKERTCLLTFCNAYEHSASAQADCNPIRFSSVREKWLFPDSDV